MISADVVEYIGVWWLPENAENKIHGKLEYDSRKETTLSLDGAFNRSPVPEEFHRIILGDSYGKKITLENCARTNFQVKHRRNGKQYLTSEFIASVFYVGYHFLKRKDVKFTQLTVRYSQLEEWLGERPFRYEERKNEKGLREHILKFTMPNVKEIALDKFKISIGYGFSTSLGAFKKPDFEATAGLWVDVDDEMHIDRFYSIMYHIRNFLSLATGNRVSMLDIYGRNENIDQHERIQIFFRRSEEIFDEALFSPHFFPFHYKSISDHPELYFKNWFDVIENFESTYDLYFGTMYNPYLYPTHTFLSLAQALESYLSRTLDNNILPDELFKEELLPKFLGIISEIPETNHLQQLEPKARFDMNRKSFRTKLKELFKEYRDLFFFIDKKEEFIGKVVDTRNYYTPYSPSLEERAVEVANLPFLSQKLRYILIVILLTETGFEDSIIERILRRYMRYRIRRIYA